MYFQISAQIQRKLIYIYITKWFEIFAKYLLIFKLNVFLQREMVLLINYNVRITSILATRVAVLAFNLNIFNQLIH